ncbi:MAG TPA: geranylgeranylglycerol-phosphate geranylgeranyltransferase [bacterium]|nr:geranylgeranylglycerol-phosphate geranylgeranyltransferase [bacterium]HQG44077.1 geranylgeranylglycerol-phosphate geranylgeranyltransferase [bacterium]HQI47782.1 geranylgeranylglycerol-phosphate geranylgeranyltransferase [bacterium]HQJ63212.1 geranylgeranylglycerol-phosphate geranylgeranyltransferase [bacterium]
MPPGEFSSAPRSTRSRFEFHRLTETLSAFYALSRPMNVLIAGLSIFLAGSVCGIDAAWRQLILACAVGALITAAANGINDYFDIEIDRINKPHRPLPSARITKGECLLFVLLCFAAAVVLAFLINFWALVITLSSSLLLYWYSARLKRTVLWGNLAVSLVTGLAFFFGGVAVGHFQRALIPAVFSFLMHLGREIIKDMEDVEGDAALQAMTLPVVYGLLPARRLATAVLLLLLVVTWAPWTLGFYGIGYLLILLAGVHSVLLLVIWAIWRRPGRATWGWTSSVLKADMLVGLLAIYAGRW